MLDIHTHILPGMDDGSADPEETLALLRLLKQQGVTMVGATPHFYAKKDSPEDFLQRRDEAFSRMPQEEGLPRVIPGAEVAYFEGMGRSEALSQLRLGDSGLLLVEMPFSTWSHRAVEEICALPMSLGVTAVLAHVDRYQHRGQLKTYGKMLLEQGVYFQCNATVFQKFASRRWALRELKYGKIHFLGSDCHNMTTRQPCMDEAHTWMKKALGENFLQQFQENALELLNME